jgi:hypothetical protein
MFGDASEEEVSKVPLSNNTVSRWIDEMPHDIETEGYGTSCLRYNCLKALMQVVIERYQFLLGLRKIQI